MTSKNFPQIFFRPFWSPFCDLSGSLFKKVQNNCRTFSKHFCKQTQKNSQTFSKINLGTFQKYFLKRWREISRNFSKQFSKLSRKHFGINCWKISKAFFLGKFAYPPHPFFCSAVPLKKEYYSTASIIYTLVIVID